MDKTIGDSLMRNKNEDGYSEGKEGGAGVGVDNKINGPMHDRPTKGQ